LGCGEGAEIVEIGLPWSAGRGERGPTAPRSAGRADFGDIGRPWPGSASWSSDGFSSVGCGSGLRAGGSAPEGTGGAGEGKPWVACAAKASSVAVTGGSGVEEGGLDSSIASATVVNGTSSAEPCGARGSASRELA